MNKNVHGTLKKVLNTVKRVIFEKGRLIYYLNIPSYTKSVRAIEAKPKKEKINLAFMVQCPEIWITSNPIYEAALRDERFNVSIILVPEMSFAYYVFLQDVEYEKIYQFGHKTFGDKCIESYNPVTKEWLDIKTLDLDYVFIPRPYETYLPKQYRASAIRRFAKVCYVSYAFPILNDSHILYNSHFVRNANMIFCEQQHSFDYVCKRFARTYKSQLQKFFYTGYPRFDMVEEHTGAEGKLWSKERSAKVKRIIWTPRWTVDPKLGGSNFFNYKDKFIEFAENHGNVDFILRPHPMAFDNFIAQGLITEEELQKYIERYQKSGNAVIDRTAEYLDTFYSSDVLVSDASSVTVDYLFTGNPVIYCPSVKESYGVPEEIMRCFYLAESFGDISRILEEILNGKDTKKEIREKTVVALKRDGKIGENIIGLIKKDYYK